MTLDELIYRWRLPPQFALELEQVLFQHTAASHNAEDDRSEAWSKSECRLVAGQFGTTLYTNNVGVLLDANERPVRYGLANESPKMNAIIKSADGIGIYKYVARPQDVGRTFGLFMSVEYKRPNWKFTGDGREAAQQTWCNYVNRMGGIGLFATRGQDIIDRLVNDSLLSTDQLIGLRK